MKQNKKEIEFFVTFLWDQTSEERSICVSELFTAGAVNHWQLCPAWHLMVITNNVSILFWSKLIVQQLATI
jgi:hypothetical protein